MPTFKWKWPSKVLVFLISILSLQSVAEARKSLHAQHTGQGYSMGGCGVGSVVLGTEDSVGPQLAAAFISKLFGAYSFSITSGTSNCDGDGFQKESDEVALRYIRENQDQIQKEAARGEGETLLGLSDVLGCSAQVELMDSLKKNYAKIDWTQTGVEASENFLKQLKSQKELQENCSGLKS